MADEYKPLLERAKGYLQQARNSLTFESYDECLSHCYRAIDRALQALTAFHHQAAPPAGESLERLCATLNVAPKDPALLAVVEKAYEHTGAPAVDANGQRLFSALEAAEGLRVASEVVEAVEKRISAKDRPGRG